MVHVRTQPTGVTGSKRFDAIDHDGVVGTITSFSETNSKNKQTQCPGPVYKLIQLIQLIPASKPLTVKAPKNILHSDDAAPWTRNVTVSYSVFSVSFSCKSYYKLRIFLPPITWITSYFPLSSDARFLTHTHTHLSFFPSCGPSSLGTLPLCERLPQDRLQELGRTMLETSDEEGAIISLSLLFSGLDIPRI